MIWAFSAPDRGAEIKISCSPLKLLLDYLCLPEAVLSGRNLTPAWIYDPCAPVQKKKGGGGHIVCVCSFHYMCLSKCVTPSAIPCLILSTGSSRLCLPSSQLTTEAAAALQCHVPTLMSPSLTSLAVGSGFATPPASTPPPCPLIYCTPCGSQAEGRSSSSRKGGGVGESLCGGCSLFPFLFHCLSLFMTSPAWPGLPSDPRESVESAVHWWLWPS